MPKVSIITASYQATWENHLRAEQSLREQTSHDFEWVVVLDGPAEDFGVVDSGLRSRTKFVELYNNYGPSVARNVGFQVSDGDIIAYLDTDDELAPDRVETLIKTFEIGDMDILLSSYKIFENDKEYIYEPGKMGHALPSYLERQNVCIPLGIAHKRRPFVSVGGFQPGIVCGEDGIMLRRMYESGFEFAYSAAIAGTYHVSLRGQSRTQRRFEMGGFAFDAGNTLGSHGQYLDLDWFKNFHSRELMDK